MIDTIALELEREFAWFAQLMQTAFALHFETETGVVSIREFEPPNLKKSKTPYALMVKEFNFGFEERLVLSLGLLQVLKPQALDSFLIKNQNTNARFFEFGGKINAEGQVFLPTFRTVSFILGGTDVVSGLLILDTFKIEHPLFLNKILELDIDTEVVLEQEITISSEYFGLITSGVKVLPEYSTQFPAKEINTDSNWEDLVVNPRVMEQLDEIKSWLLHTEQILDGWGLKKTLKPGFRTLFYGASGTGKTFAATLIGKETKRPVFRVDLSMVVSKYIGETEKNLSKLFDIAENREWILFFDEGDALFGKRSETKGSNDRYANQEVAYLLQRIEDFSGLVILATNLAGNIDDAFSRRFQSMIHFPMPDVAQREALWAQLFAKNFALEKSIDLNQLASDYELTGGELINVLRYCALEAAKRNKKMVVLKDVMIGIRREYSKQKKTL